MLEWLEGWLSEYPGAALIVSHDRTFLDRTVTRILDLCRGAPQIETGSGEEQIVGTREV